MPKNPTKPKEKTIEEKVMEVMSAPAETPKPEEKPAEDEKTGLVKNASAAYGYNYASLSDIVKQGYKIPKMRVARIEGDDYIEYYDKETGEWQLGVPVVRIEMKGMNPAQAYGSALTYARRYTAQLALSLACDDDKKLENDGSGKTATKPTGNFSKGSSKIDFNAIRKQIDGAKSVSELNKIYVGVPEKLRQYFVKDCEKRKGELTANENIPTPTDEELNQYGR